MSIRDDVERHRTRLAEKMKFEQGFGLVDSYWMDNRVLFTHDALEKARRHEPHKYLSVLGVLEQVRFILKERNEDRCIPTLSYDEDDLYEITLRIRR